MPRGNRDVVSLANSETTARPRCTTFGVTDARAWPPSRRSRWVDKRFDSASRLIHASPEAIYESWLSAEDWLAGYRRKG